MKKLSLLVALCLLITVGGVYATWNYAQNQEIAGDVDYITNIALTEKVTLSNMGTLNIDVSAATVLVDDSGHYDPEMLADDSSVVVVTFSPNDGAPLEDRVAKDVILTIGFTDQTFEWTDKDDTPHSDKVFEYVDPAVTTITLAASAATEIPNANGELSAYTWEVKVADIIDLVKFADHIILDTPELYDAFALLLARSNISITAEIAPASLSST